LFISFANVKVRLITTSVAHVISKQEAPQLLGRPRTITYQEPKIW